MNDRARNQQSKSSLTNKYGRKMQFEKEGEMKINQKLEPIVEDITHNEFY